MARSRMNSGKDERIIIHFDDTTRAWNDWKHGNILHKPFVDEQYTASFLECTKMCMSHQNSLENPERFILPRSSDIPALVRKSPERDSICQMCRKHQGQLYPCRICGKVYHQQCIKDMGDAKSYCCIKNANNPIGWSCPTCEDLRLLLSPEDLAETNEWIKSLGVQFTFDLNNYIDARLKTKLANSYQSNELNASMKNILQVLINTVSNFFSNSLSQTDLVTLDVVLKLLRTSPQLLVNALTSFELYRLSQLFLSLSSLDDDQCLTYEKFDQVFSAYLLTTLPDLNFEEKQSHVQALAYALLGDRVDSDRTWSQFVLDATIPTLLGRLNHRTPSEFISRISSSQPSTSQRTVHLSERRDDQSLTILMNSLLQKLKQSMGTDLEPIQTHFQKKSTQLRRTLHRRMR